MSHIEFDGQYLINKVDDNTDHRIVGKAITKRKPWALTHEGDFLG